MTGRRGTWKHGLGTEGHFQPDGVGLAFLCGTEYRWNIFDSTRPGHASYTTLALKTVIHFQPAPATKRREKYFSDWQNSSK